jgi:hypothetical protein
VKTGLLRRVLPAALVLFLAGCSSASGSGGGLGGATGFGSSAGTGASGGSGGGGGSGGLVIDGGTGGGGGTSPGCSEASQYVYVVDDVATLYRFDPPSLTFTSIGILNCPAAFLETPFSMAVDRNANAWVVYTDGTLYQVDTTTANCTATSFAPGQSGFVTFGMGFSTAGVGSTQDGLYVSDSAYGGSTATKGLATIDTGSLALLPIGLYDQLSARAELTGTGDGRLYGAFEGTPYIVAEIDKTNASIKSQAPQTAIQYAPGTSNFAFAFWGGSFWLFVGPGFSTDVFQYDPAAGTTLLKTSVGFAIVGAGVSTCAPLTPPK